ncbi:MAG TPA: hypothetical protein VM619_10590 [Luteimonas sp.]|nr:hypothetical protein [Luteimonas sp.]
MPALCALALLAGCRPQGEAERSTASADDGARAEASGPKWAVSPARAGRDRPPAGRSLFDFVASREQDGRLVQDVPFPFPALLRRLEERAGCGAAPGCVRAVLIPLGRSLQRLAASPDFFRHPRVVATVVEDRPGAVALLRDRIYIGYQEQSALLEVISYNEAAGRFEFQLVHDYRAGGNPRVAYARRQVCTACHQNLAPIFSRPLWTETNANPAVAQRMAALGEAPFGVALRRGVDVPEAIDDASDRANLLGVWQRLWRDGCGGDDAGGRRCRGAVVLAALQYRLGGERGFDAGAVGWRKDFVPVFEREWQRLWPAGMAIPNPDIPSRDPLPPATAPQVAGTALADIPARFEPLLPRVPLETWMTDPDPLHATAAMPLAAVARRYVAGLAGYFTVDDVHALERQLRARANGAAAGFRSDCTIDRDATALRFHCDAAPAPGKARLAGSVALRGDDVAGGRIEGLAVEGGTALNAISIAPGTAVDAHGVTLRPDDRGLPLRLADGARVDAIRLQWDDAGAATATVDVVDDLAPLRDAVAALAGDGGKSAPLAKSAFDRARITAALFERMGMDGNTACCSDASRLAPAHVEPAAPKPPTAGPAQPYAAFYKPCAGCHSTGERTPPNFLAGDGAQVAANLRHCAPRIYVRLAMNHRKPALREKTPMPPPFAPAASTPAGPARDVAELETIAARLLREQAGRAPRLDALLADGYEALPACLPPVVARGAAP